jgi:hypothetical protein
LVGFLWAVMQDSASIEHPGQDSASAA